MSPLAEDGLRAIGVIMIVVVRVMVMIASQMLMIVPRQRKRN